MTQRKPLVVDGNNRQAEIPSGDELYAPDGIATRPGPTGGGDAKVRHVWLAPAGFVYITDASGNRIGFVGPDGSPADNLVIGGGTGPGGGLDSILVDLATGLATIPDLDTTTQAYGDASLAAASTEFVQDAVAPLAAAPIIINLFSGAASTIYGSTTKRALGSIYFDPTNPVYGLSAGSTATLCMLLESSSGSVAAAGELFQKSGTGSPQVIAATSTTTNTTATLVTANVSAAFTNTSAPGIFVARLWIVTPNGLNQATCTGAWIEVTR